MKIKKSKTRVLISMTPLEYSRLRAYVVQNESDEFHQVCTEFEEADAAPVRVLRDKKSVKKVCNFIIPLAGKRRDTGLCDGWCNNCDVRVSGYATLSKALKAVEEAHPKTITVPNKKKGRK